MPVSRNRDIATILGKTEKSNTSNAALSTGGGGGGLTAYDSAGLLPASATPGTMAYTQDDNYFHIYDSNDANWAKISLTAAHSTSSLISGNRIGGLYSILDPGTGTTKTTYFDATTGYALYSSFGTGGTYASSSTYTAWNGNAIKQSQLSTYGYTLSASAWADGTSSSNFGSYTAKTGYFAFYSGGSGTATFDMSSWNGPSDVTDLRVVWGAGDTANTGSDQDLFINGTEVVSNASSENIYTGSFDRTGSTPLLRVYEGSGSIAGIAQIWFRNG